MQKDSDYPAPLTPPYCDLRGNEWMPYYGNRLLNSDFDAKVSDAEFRAAHNLWWSAWNQVPAASLPDDDAVLCKLAGLGRDMKSWRKVRNGALHGFVKCSDGRLYHKFLSEVAIDSYAKRLKAAEKREGDRARLAAWRAMKAAAMKREQGKSVDGDETASETRFETPDETQPETSKTGQDGTGQDNNSEPKGSGAGAPSPGEGKDDPDAGIPTSALKSPVIPSLPVPKEPDYRTLAWREGKRVISELTGMSASRAGGILSNLAKAVSNDFAALCAILQEAERIKPLNAVAWLTAAAQERAAPGTRTAKKNAFGDAPLTPLEQVALAVLQGGAQQPAPYAGTTLEGALA